MPSLSPTLCGKCYIGRHFQKGNNPCREAPQEIAPESDGATSAPLVLEYWSQATRARKDVAELPPKFLLHEPSNHPVSETVFLVSFILGSLSTERIWVPHFILWEDLVMNSLMFSFPLPFLSPSLPPLLPPPPFFAVSLCLSLCLGHGVHIIAPEYLYFLTWMLHFWHYNGLKSQRLKKKAFADDFLNLSLAWVCEYTEHTKSLVNSYVAREILKIFMNRWQEYKSCTVPRMPLLLHSPLSQERMTGWGEVRGWGGAYLYILHATSRQ